MMMDLIEGRETPDVLKAGLLWKRTSSSIRRWKVYHFVLTRLSLLCYRRENDPYQGRGPKLKLDLCNVDRIERVSKKGQLTNCFWIFSGKIRLQLKAANDPEAKDWMETLEVGSGICRKRERVQVELQRASFKRHVEDNVREKFRCSSPDLSLDCVPSVTYLRRTGSEDINVKAVGLHVSRPPTPDIGKVDKVNAQLFSSETYPPRPSRAATPSLQKNRILSSWSESPDLKAPNALERYPRSHRYNSWDCLPSYNKTNPLHSWSSSLNLVPEEDILESFCDSAPNIYENRLGGHGQSSSRSRENRAKNRIKKTWRDAVLEGYDSVSSDQTDDEVYGNRGLISVHGNPYVQSPNYYIHNHGNGHYGNNPLTGSHDGNLSCFYSKNTAAYSSLQPRSSRFNEEIFFRRAPQYKSMGCLRAKRDDPEFGNRAIGKPPLPKPKPVTPYAMRRTPHRKHHPKSRGTAANRQRAHHWNRAIKNGTLLRDSDTVMFTERDEVISRRDFESPESEEYVGQTGRSRYLPVAGNSEWLEEKYEIAEGKGEDENGQLLQVHSSNQKAWLCTQDHMSIQRLLDVYK